MKFIAHGPQRFFRSPLESFLGIAPFTENAAELSRKQIEDKSYPRNQLATQLKNYNEEINNDKLALENIERLRDTSSTCIVTGQQLGFMGGPSYTILKGITCLLVARQTNSVPIFWLATEDHDVAEIDHTYLLDPLGNLDKYHIPLPKNGESVEDLTLDSRHEFIISQFSKQTKLPSLPFNTSYAQTMMGLLVHLFAGTGMVFLEPKILRRLAIPFFKKEISEGPTIFKVLQNTSKLLEKAGGKQLLALNEEDTNLFMKLDGKIRTKIRRSDQGFLVGKRTFTNTEMIKLIESSPQLFSPNAAARPVLQNLLLPTLAYIAGPHEMHYWMQLKEYHQFHGANMSWILPRLAATILSPYAQELMEKIHLDPWESIPRHWIEWMPELITGIEEMAYDWMKSVTAHFSEDLTEDAMSRYIRHFATKMQHRVVKKRLKNQDIPTHTLHYLKNLLHPHGKPQDRVLNWCGFQSETKQNLVQAFLQQADWRQPRHLYCYL